jgi:hypothetical protein
MLIPRRHSSPSLSLLKPIRLVLFRVVVLRSERNEVV